MQDSPDIGRVVLIGPCGLQRGVPAHFTQQLAEALRRRHPCTRVLIGAATAGDRPVTPPPTCCTELAVNDKRTYAESARYLNRPALGVDVVSLQHHFDLYGGPDGEFILSFLENLDVPVVTTLHQVPGEPTRHRARTTEQLLALSDRVVVTDHVARTLLEAGFGVTPDSLDVIPVPSSEARLRDQVSASMNEATATTKSGRRSSRSSDAWNWDTVAEFYNRSFVQAIIHSRPVKRPQRAQPWPWTHRRDFAASSGVTPGWDD